MKQKQPNPSDFNNDASIMSMLMIMDNDDNQVHVRWSCGRNDHCSVGDQSDDCFDLDLNERYHNDDNNIRQITSMNSVRHNKLSRYRFKEDQWQQQLISVYNNLININNMSSINSKRGFTLDSSEKHLSIAAMAAAQPVELSSIMSQPNHD